MHLWCRNERKHDMHVQNFRSLFQAWVHMQYPPTAGPCAIAFLQPPLWNGFSCAQDPQPNSCVVVPAFGMPLPCYPMCAAGQGNTTSPVAVPVQYPLNRFPAYRSLDRPFQGGSPTGCHNITEPSLRRADFKQRSDYEYKMMNPKYRWPTSQTRIGIDRINSCGNYEITNCVPCCAKCNFMKGSLNYREFVDHARRITFSMRTRDSPFTSAPLLESPLETPGKRRKRSC